MTEAIEPEDQHKKYLKLHSGIAHMTYVLAKNSLLSSFYILKRVLPYLDEEKAQRFSIPLKEIIAFLGTETRNRDYVRKMLSAARKADIVFNVLGKDKGNNYIESGLFSEVGIIDGNVIVQIPLEITKRMIASKEMFVNLDLDELVALQYSKAIPLFIVLSDYCQANKKKTELKITLEDLKKLLGYKKDSYQEYKEFNKFVIKKAVDEINKSNSLRVTYEIGDRVSRKVNSIKFSIFPKAKLIASKTSYKNSGKEFGEKRNDIYYPNNKDVINKFIEMGFVLHKVASKTLFALMDSPHQLTHAEVDHYLLYSLGKINFLKADNAGAIISGAITKSVYLEGFLLEKEKNKHHIITQEKIEKRKSLLDLESEFKKIHSERKVAMTQIYIQENYLSIKANLEGYSEKNIMLRLFVKKSDKNIKELVLLKKWPPTFASGMLSFAEEFGILDEDFDLQKYMDDPEYKELRNRFLST